MQFNCFNDLSPTFSECAVIWERYKDGFHICANHVRANIIMTESRTWSTYKLRSHLPLCILSRSCLSWPAQTGCWLHYRMLSKKHHFIISNLLFKSVFSMNELAHYFTFLWLCFDTASWIYNRVIWIYKPLLRNIKINKIILPSLVHWMISVRNVQAYSCL